MATHLGIEHGGSLLIVGVESGSQAETLGLRAHDVVVSVNGAAIRSAADAAQTLRKAAEEKAALRLEIVRAGKRETLTR